MRANLQFSLLLGLTLTLAAWLCLITSAIAASVDSNTSPAGIEFHFMPIANADTVGIQVAWKSNWPYEEEAVATPYFGAQMIIAGGAGQLRGRDIAKKLKNMKADGGFFSRADNFHGFLHVASDDIEDAAGLGALVLGDPKFTKSAYNRTRLQFIKNISEAQKQPVNRIVDTLRRSVFGKQNINNYLTLWPITVAQKSDMASLRQWHKQTFTRANAVVSIAGDIDSNRAGMLVDKLLAELPAGDKKFESASSEQNIEPRTIVIRDEDLDKDHIGLMMPLAASQGDAELEDAIISSILGRGLNSRLATSISKSLRINFTVDPFTLKDTHDFRALAFIGTTDSDNTAKIRNLLRNIWDTFIEEGPTSKEVLAAKSSIRKQYQQALKSPKHASRLLLDAVLTEQPPQKLDQLINTLDAIDVELIKARLDTAYTGSENLIEVLLMRERKIIKGACYLPANIQHIVCE